MPLSGRARSLAIGLVLAVVLAILLTPLGGLETRSIADTTAIGLSTIVLFLVGLVLDVAAIGALFRRPRTASILAFIGLILYFPIFLADLAGLWSSKPAPPAILYLSIITATVHVGVLFLAARVYRENTAKTPAAA
jgi:hypothetical protein